MLESQATETESEAKVKEEKVQALKRQLYVLTSNVITASENGLFNVKGPYENEIDKALQKVGTDLEHKQYTDAENSLYKAQRLFDESWNSAPKCWMICYERGWMHHLFSFFGAGAAVMVLCAIWPLDIFNIDKSAALFGFIGAMVRCIYWTSVQANVRMLRRVWIVQNFFAPLIGLIFGCIADFILKSSLVLIVQDKAEPNKYLAGVIIFYAGFNWEWIIGILAKVKSQIQIHNSDKTKEGK